MKERKTGGELESRHEEGRAGFRHFTAMAEGVVGQLAGGFECPEGRAWMTMKTWARDADESADMIRVIGKNIGFVADGEVMIYDTEPEEPPSDKPCGYDIRFTPYDDK